MELNLQKEDDLWLIEVPPCTAEGLSRGKEEGEAGRLTVDCRAVWKVSLLGLRNGWVYLDRMRGEQARVFRMALDSPHGQPCWAHPSRVRGRYGAKILSWA